MSVATRTRCVPDLKPSTARRRSACVRSACRAAARMPCDCRSRASRSAPRLVDEKTSVGPGARRRKRESHAVFSWRPSSSALCVMRGRGRVADAELHQLGRLHDLQREAHDLFGHRRGEEQRLARAAGRQLRHDELDVRPEAHVEHPVGFVEHEHVEAGEGRDAGAQVIHQPARRGDDDVDAGLERLLLAVHADAAEDGRAAHRRVVAEALHVVFDLDGEFAGGGQHEDAGRAFALGVDLQQPLHQREQERRGLARAGLGAGDEVVAGGHGVEDRALDRGRLLETPVLDAHEQLRHRDQVREPTGLDVGGEGLELREQLGVAGGGLGTGRGATRSGPASAGPGASFRAWTHSSSSVWSSRTTSGRRRRRIGVGSVVAARLAAGSSNSTEASRSSSSS